MTSTNVKLARTYLSEVWSHGRLELVPDLVAPDCAVRDPLVGDHVGIEAIAAHIREVRRAFPDLAWMIDEVIADEGQQLALTWSARGTHRDAFAGIAATDRPIRVGGLLLLRFEHEHLIAITTRWNPQDLFRQLRSSAPRLVPTPAAPMPRAPRASRVARGSMVAMPSEASAWHAPAAAPPRAAVEVASDLDAQWEL